MGEELNRNYGVLKAEGGPPPYFMSYEITEEEYHVVSASLGAITASTAAARGATWMFPSA